MRALFGSNVSYADLVDGTPGKDFDADEVMDHVLDRMGIGGDGQ